MVDIDQTGFGQRLAHFVHVEPQHARGELAAFVLLVGLAFGGLAGDRPGLGQRHHHHAVIIRHDHITGADRHTGANDRHIDRPQRGFDRSLGRNRLGPDRKAHLLQGADIAASGIDDQAFDPARLQRGGQQVAEHAVAVVGGHRHHQHIAGLALFDRHMQHPVVARLGQHGDGTAGNGRPCPDRPHIGLHQADTAHAFMHARHAVTGQSFGKGGIDAVMVADNNGFHANSSSTIGNSR